MSIDHDTRKPALATLEDTLAKNAAIADERQKRINDCVVEDTDCALSMWASDASAAKLRVQLDLARNGWKAKFKVLFKDGKAVQGRKVETQFGTRWVIDGKFLPCYGAEETGRRASNFAKLGFSWVEMELDAHVAQSFGSYIGAPSFAFAVPDNKDLITV
jgi:hypothetical protein